MRSLDNSEVAGKINEICRKLNAKNMLASADGNVSFRLNENEMMITPSGVNKAFITERDISVVTLDNVVVSGNPSSERLMHLEVYRRCPEAKAIIHAHPPNAIAYSIARPDEKELPSEAMSELILSVGSIPIVPFARPGTQGMGDVLRPFLPHRRVMILARHGGLSWGETLDEAYNGMERLDHTAMILRYAHQFGGITKLPEEEIAFLRDLRAKLGNRTL